MRFLVLESDIDLTHGFWLKNNFLKNTSTSFHQVGDVLIKLDFNFPRSKDYIGLIQYFGSLVEIWKFRVIGFHVPTSNYKTMGHWSTNATELFLTLFFFRLNINLSGKNIEPS